MNSKQMKGTMKMTNTLGENIRKLRIENNMNQKDLAQKLGVSTSALSQYESGARTPSNEIMCQIATMFNVTVDFLLGRKHDMEYPQLTPVNGVVKIPVVGTVRAGEPMLAEENITEMIGLPDTLASDGREYFGLKVSGDSMNLCGILDRQIVVVRRQQTISNGQIAVVLIEGEEATVKRFYRSGNIVTLVPHSSNKDYTPKTLDISKVRVEILGRVVQAILNL